MYCVPRRAAHLVVCLCVAEPPPTRAVEPLPMRPSKAFDNPHSSEAVATATQVSLKTGDATPTTATAGTAGASHGASGAGAVAVEAGKKGDVVLCAAAAFDA